MPQPDIGDLHVNGLLTNLSIAHMNALDSFVADKCFPPLGVDKQSDIYPVYTRGDFFQGSEDAQALRNLVRAPGTKAVVAGYTVDVTNTYFASNFAVGVEIPDELRSNADAVFNLDRDATNLATMIQTIRRERAFAADHMITGQWGTDKTVSNKWSDYGASDPLTDLEDGIDQIERDTGQRPNKLLMGAIVWRRLKHHPDLVDRIKGGATSAAPAMVTRELLAQVLELDEVVIGRALYRSSAEGASVSLARILDDDALLLYATPTPGLMVPTAGVTFFWKPIAGGNIQFMRKLRDDDRRKDTVESHSYMDHVITETKSGYFFSDVVD